VNTWLFYTFTWHVGAINRYFMSANTSLLWPTAHSRSMRGQGMPTRHHLVLSQRCLLGEAKLPGHHYWWGVLSSLYMSMEYHIVKRVLTRWCLPPGKVMMLFRRVPQAWPHQWWWDGFPTQVTRVRVAWVPAAMSHRGRCLSVSRSPQAWEGLGSLFG
jgi:hypothetical protein